MNGEMAAREMTCEEWAERLVSGMPHNPKPAEMLAIALKHAEARGASHERDACYRLANDHALTIDERYVAETPYGRHMTEQQRIDVASSQRHVAQYVGSLIFDRNPKPPPGFRIDR